MKTSREYQDEIGHWAEKNFDYIDQVGWGLIEELGEYCRAILKHKQNIRRHALKGGRNYEIDLKDSIADGMIFCLHWAYIHEVFISFEEAEKCDKDLNENEIISCILVYLSRMLMLHVDGAFSVDSARSVAQLIFNGFAMLAKSRGWDWQKILRMTWKEVSKRDWRKYPTDGKTK